MIKKTLLSILAISALVPTQALAWQRNAAAKKYRELKQAVAIEGRHVFPIYQEEGVHFVAIRSAHSGLGAHVVDAPNSERFHDQVWAAFDSAQSSSKTAQTDEELEGVMKRLDGSKLAGFVVFNSKDWNKEGNQGVAPYYFADAEFLDLVSDSSPYFSDIKQNMDSTLDNFGVVFQALQKRAEELTKRLNAQIEAQENPVKSEL